jgi:hypothetical protein
VGSKNGAAALLRLSVGESEKNAVEIIIVFQLKGTQACEFFGL